MLIVGHRFYILSHKYIRLKKDNGMDAILDTLSLSLSPNPRKINNLKKKKKTVLNMKRKYLVCPDVIA